MILIATIPVGLTGLVFEHWFRTLFAKPVAASAFLVVNGCILLAGERFCRRREASLRKAGEVWRAASLAKAARAGHAELPIAGGSVEADAANVPGLGRGRTARPAAGRGGRADDELAEAYASDLRISRFPYRDTLFVGLCQILALFAGISRDGVTMVGGLWRGLDREDAARFAFLLATPPILAAGILKLPSLAGHAGAHIHGQVVVGFVIAGVSAYVSVRFLVRYFRTHRSLTPFGVYCLIAGLASIIRFT
jgi:undecaprenyl-diphosphatase